MAGLLDISPDLLKQIIANSQLGGEKGLLYGGTSAYTPLDNNSYIQFGLSGDKSKYNSGLTNANAEYGQGNNAFGVSYNKYYNPMPVMIGAEGQNIMPEALQNKLQYFGNNQIGDLLNLYFRRNF